jgi:hypothetical protein
MKTSNEKLDEICNVRIVLWLFDMLQHKSSFFVSDGLDLEEFLQAPLSVEAALKVRLVLRALFQLL